METVTLTFPDGLRGLACPPGWRKGVDGWVTATYTPEELAIALALLDRIHAPAGKEAAGPRKVQAVRMPDEQEGR